MPRPDRHPTNLVDTKGLNRFKLKKIREETRPIEELAAVQDLVEEKLSQVTPMPTDEELLKIMNTHKSAPRPMRHGTDTYRKLPPSNLPEVLKAMPDGEEKEKAIKAAAQAALLLGQTPGSVATQYGIPHAIASNWATTVTIANSITRRDRLNDIILAYVEQEFKSLMAISIITSDEVWVKRQDADTLAHYVAVKSDRLLMLLQAFGRVEEAKKRYVEQLEVVIQET